MSTGRDERLDFLATQFAPRAVHNFDQTPRSRFAIGEIHCSAEPVLSKYSNNAIARRCGSSYPERLSCRVRAGYCALPTLALRARRERSESVNRRGGSGK
jgi:hypothetical protein